MAPLLKLLKLELKWLRKRIILIVKLLIYKHYILMILKLLKTLLIKLED